MKMEIKGFTKGTVVLCTISTIGTLLFSLTFIYWNEYGFFALCLALALFFAGYTIYTYVTSGNYLIDKYGIHVFHCGKEVNL